MDIVRDDALRCSVCHFATATNVLVDLKQLVETWIADGRNPGNLLFWNIQAIVRTAPVLAN